MRGFFPKGSDFDLLVESGVLTLRDDIIDARVTLGPKRDVHCRLVMVRGPKGICFYLTNLDGHIKPQQVAELYRVRWEIDNKLDKSCLNLSEIGARTGPAVRALVHASLLGSMVVSLLAYHHRRRE